MINYKINDKISSAPLNCIKIGGSVGKQMDEFLEKRVLCDFAKNEIFEEALKAFEEKRDDETPIGFWRGEFWGKLAISAVRTYKYTMDESLKEFLVDNAHRLLNFADSDGYIGSYKNPDNVLAIDTKIGREIMGWDCNWNWNVWCRKYTLWGLIEIYDISGDSEILSGAINLCDHLISQLERLGLGIMEVGTFNGLASGSILKPILKLYEITEDKKYLDFCLKATEWWEREDGCCPNLITNAMSGKPIHSWYPDPNSWAKAYEMLSCLDGLCELYRLTGNEKYFETCSKLYDVLREHEYNVLFSVGFNDQFSHGSAHQNSLTEACDVIHWMRLGSELYKLTGNIKYIDDIERAFYNAFLASSFSDGTWAARTVRSSGRNEWATQMDMKYSHCCTNNMPRGYLNVAENFVTYSNDTVFINFFTEFDGTLPINDGEIGINISGSYLENGRVKIIVNSKKAMNLKIRIPLYSHSTSIIVDDDKYTTESVGYYSLGINEGETHINIKFNWRVEICDFAGVVEDIPEKDFRYRRYVEGKYKFDRNYMVWNRRSTLVYGPLLLTRSKKCGNTVQEMFESDKTVCGKNYKCNLIPINNDNVRVCFNAVFENENDRFETMVCDFASGSNDFVGENCDLFNIWF